MKKSILALAAVVALANVANAPVAEARGFRIGFGFGVPFGHRPMMADPTILQRAQEANERVKARERQVMMGGRYQSNGVTARMRHEQVSAAREAHRQAAMAAAKARAEKLAAAAEARRQAQAAAIAAKAEAAAKAKKNVQIAKPAVVPTMAAVPAAVAPVSLTGDKRLDVAQDEQKAKADELLKSIAKPTAAPTAQLPRQAGSDVSPFDTGAPVAPVAPAVVTLAPPVEIKPVAPVAPAKPAPAAECLRFIPGAGITVKVSCSE